MKLPPTVFTVTNFAEIPSSVEVGQCGDSLSRTVVSGRLRLRLVDYQAGYVADHWCDRGHVFYVLEGEIDVELRDGRRFSLRPGMSFHVSDYGDAAHRVSTARGGAAFIVD